MSQKIKNFVKDFTDSINTTAFIVVLVTLNCLAILFANTLLEYLHLLIIANAIMGVVAILSYCKKKLWE